jgi:hypothetical protein
MTFSFSRSSLAAATVPLVILIAAACGTSGTSTEASSPATPSDTPAPVVTASPSAPAEGSAPPAEEPGPSAKPFFVDLSTSNGATVRLEVDDRTGTVSGASSGVPGDGASVPPEAPTAVNLDETTVRVTWSAMPCETQPALFIYADRLLLVQPPCDQPGDSIALDRVVDLHFSTPIDVSKLELTIQEGRDTAA